MRSGIGLSRRQKEIVRSLGLKRLNQIVERPDTPQIRGMVAKVSHLVSLAEPHDSESRVLPAEYVVTRAESKAVPSESQQSPAREDEVGRAETAATGAPAGATPELRSEPAGEEIKSETTDGQK